MFAESMLETSWAQRTRQGWTTLTSFGLQAVVISLLLMLPLWRTVGLAAGAGSFNTGNFGIAVTGGARVHRQNVTTIVPRNLDENVIVAPREVPLHISMIDEPSGPPQISPSPSGTRDGMGNGSGDVWRALGDSIVRPAPLPVPAPAPTARVFRSSDCWQEAWFGVFNPCIRRWRGARGFKGRWFCRQSSAKRALSRICALFLDIRCW